MRYLLCLLLLTFLNTFAPVWADETRMVAPSEEDVSYVARTWPVVERVREGSVLRVAFHSVGPFPVTDVSPLYDLMLSVWVLFPEHSAASATWPIGGMVSPDMAPPRRVEAGVYEVTVRTWGTASIAVECLSVDVTYRVDARAATIEGRAARPEFFEHAGLESLVGVEVVEERCVEG